MTYRKGTIYGWSLRFFNVAISLNAVDGIPYY